MQQLFRIHDIGSERFRENHPEHVNSVRETNPEGVGERGGGCFEGNRGELVEFVIDDAAAAASHFVEFKASRTSGASKSPDPSMSWDFRVFETSQV